MIVDCRSCHAKIRWVRTPAGKLMPIDARPAAAGNVFLEVTLYGETIGRVLAGKDLADARSLGAELWMPHHATCPQGKQWRRDT